jgi:glycosyltransferase involved in cell wall biosynthesis
MRRQKACSTICFLGGARYSQPLDATNEKKFRALRSLGEMRVVGFSYDLRPRQFTQHAHFYLLAKLPLATLRYVEMFLLGPLLACWLIFRHGVRVLVAQSPYEGFAAALAKKIAIWLGYKVVLVVESHGDFEKSLFLQRRILLRRIYRCMMHQIARFSLKNADCLRSISYSTRQQLEHWVPGKTIVQFPTWTDIEVFLHAGLKEKELPTWNVLYAGVITPLKGVHHLITAFAYVSQDFPQARLAIVGRKQNAAYAAELKKQVRRLGMDGCVQFVDEVPQAELAGWMRGACAFVLPSVSEGLGRVVVEAMAAGTPVIGSHVGGIAEMVEDCVTGFLIRPGDEAMLTDRLRWILGHPEEAREMGLRARAFAEHFFSTEKYVEGYRQILEEAQRLLNLEPDDHASSRLQSCNRR